MMKLVCRPESHTFMIFDQPFCEFELAHMVRQAFQIFDNSIFNLLLLQPV